MLHLKQRLFKQTPSSFSCRMQSIPGLHSPNLFPTTCLACAHLQCNHLPLLHCCPNNLKWPPPSPHVLRRRSRPPLRLRVPLPLREARKRPAAPRSPRGGASNRWPALHFPLRPLPSPLWWVASITPHFTVPSLLYSLYLVHSIVLVSTSLSLYLLSSTSFHLSSPSCLSLLSFCAFYLIPLSCFCRSLPAPDVARVRDGRHARAASRRLRARGVRAREPRARRGARRGERHGAYTDPRHRALLHRRRDRPTLASAHCARTRRRVVRPSLLSVVGFTVFTQLIHVQDQCSYSSLFSLLSL